MGNSKRKRLMKTISSAMRSIVGSITSVKSTNGIPFIKSWLNGSRTSENLMYPQSHDGQDELLESPRLKSYEVCLSDESIYILAVSAEDAAWYALELSNDKHSELLDVRLIDE